MRPLHQWLNLPGSQGDQGHILPIPCGTTDPGTLLLGRASAGKYHDLGKQGNIYTGRWYHGAPMECLSRGQLELSFEVKHKQVCLNKVTPLTSLSGFRCKMNLFQQNLF